MVDTILRIFDDIEENLEASLSIERTAEQQRLEAYATLDARIQAEIDSLAAKLSDLGRVIMKLQFACTSYEDNRDAAQGDIDGASELKADRQAVCSEEDNAWAAENSKISF